MNKEELIEELQEIKNVIYYRNKRVSYIDLDNMCGLNEIGDCDKFINAIETVLKELEDNQADLTTVYIKGVCDEKSKWRDKIREKIEGLKNNCDYLSKFKDWKEKDYTNEDVINNCLEVLQELLEEE